VRCDCRRHIRASVRIARSRRRTGGSCMHDGPYGLNPRRRGPRSGGRCDPRDDRPPARPDEQPSYCRRIDFGWRVDRLCCRWSGPPLHNPDRLPRRGRRRDRRPIKSCAPRGDRRCPDGHSPWSSRRHFL